MRLLLVFLGLAMVFLLSWGIWGGPGKPAGWVSVVLSARILPNSATWRTGLPRRWGEWRLRKPYGPDGVPVPKFLPDLPEVRREMAEHYTSVHRADEVVGAILAELDKAGVADNTLVMFVSDHGMPLPFAKTNCYYHSNRTPWIARWPGVVKPGARNSEHDGGEA